MNVKPGTGWLALASLFFALFVANILLGKAALAPDVETPLKLSDVGEFLVLFAAVICFVAGVLRREAHANTDLSENSKIGTEGDLPPPVG